MEHNPTWLWEIGFSEFLLVTVVLGGLGAWMTGRAVAFTWRSKFALVRYCLLLALAVRFIHFSLFQGTLIAPWYFLIDLVVLLAIGFAGMQVNRSGQMARQYGFEFERVGNFGWRRRG